MASGRSRVIALCAHPDGPQEHPMPAQQQIFTVDRLSTPIGEMLLVTDQAQRLRALDWDEYEARMHRLLTIHYRRTGMQLVRGRAPESVREPIQRYLRGQLDAIDAVEVETEGTPFQRSVWKALRRIPVGTTLTYSELAVRIGRSSAVRAVGLANGANPIGVVVPCHRVIGADGSLTGYGGGLERKRWLLEHEGAAFEQRDRQLSLRVGQADALFNA